MMTVSDNPDDFAPPPRHLLDRAALRLAAFARGRQFLLLILLLLPFNLIFFPARTARLSALSGLPDPIIDVRFSYTPEEVYSLISALGPEGRRSYAISELTVDIAFPILYGSFFCLLLAFVLLRAFPTSARALRIALFPIALVLADFAENAAIFAMLVGYPRQSAWLARTASFFSSAKWVFAVLTGLLLLFGVASWVIRSIDKKRRRTSSYSHTDSG